MDRLLVAQISKLDYCYVIMKSSDLVQKSLDVYSYQNDRSFEAINGVTKYAIYLAKISKQEDPNKMDDVSLYIIISKVLLQY